MLNPEQMLALVEREISQRFKKKTTLKPHQQKVLHALAKGENVFAGLPTGYGKSLCYWAPASAWKWRVWVVSPLVALIQDQSQACEELGLRVASWHGGLSQMEKTHLSESMEAGEVEIAFLSPERLVQWWKSGFLAELEDRGVGPDLLALDEMHCFEEWRSFRDGYTEAIEPVRRLLRRGVSLLGLTASLSRKEAEAWMNELCESFLYVGSGLGRDNLQLNVVAICEEQERWLGLVSILKEISAPESAIIYCATRVEAEDVARWLSSAGISACAYHAGLPGNLRSARSRAFRAGRLRVVCATSAFGMGIDYPRVSTVVHFSIPYSLDSYWQEAGRGGRDGGPAVAVAFWRRSSVARARQMKSGEKEKFFLLWEAWAKGICRKQAVAESFGVQQDACGNCDRCRKIKKNQSLVGQNAEGKFILNGANAWCDHADPWWIEPEADLREWSRGKIFSGGEKS